MLVDTHPPILLEHFHVQLQPSLSQKNSEQVLKFHIEDSTVSVDAKHIDDVEIDLHDPAKQLSAMRASKITPEELRSLDDVQRIRYLLVNLSHVYAAGLVQKNETTDECAEEHKRYFRGILAQMTEVGQDFVTCFGDKGEREVQLVDFTVRTIFKSLGDSKKYGYLAN